MFKYLDLRMRLADRISEMAASGYTTPSHPDRLLLTDALSALNDVDDPFKDRVRVVPFTQERAAAMDNAITHWNGPVEAVSTPSTAADCNPHPVTTCPVDQSPCPFPLCCGTFGCAGRAAYKAVLESVWADLGRP